MGRRHARHVLIIPVVLGLALCSPAPDVKQADMDNAATTFVISSLMMTAINNCASLTLRSSTKTIDGSATDWDALLDRMNNHFSMSADSSFIYVWMKPESATGAGTFSLTLGGEERSATTTLSVGGAGCTGNAAFINAGMEIRFARSTCFPNASSSRSAEFVGVGWPGFSTQCRGPVAIP